MNERVFYDLPLTGHHPDGRSAWRDSRQWLFPPGVRRWLLDDGSLTERLTRASDNRFAVQLHSLHWQVPTASEARALALPARRRALIREVVLTCAGEPWVFARTVIPTTTLRGANRRLRFLGTRSLGAWLFREPSLVRGSFEIARLGPNGSVVPASLQEGQTLWGRRSRFEVNGYPLLVAEIFLPLFRPWPIVQGR